MTNSPSHIVFNDRIIIDDILLFSNHVPTICYHFSRVTQAFSKYRLSFKFSRYNFFQLRVKHVGYDLTARGDCPAVSKFDLLQSCSLQPYGILHLFFIGLCCFFSRYCPWLETNIKQLRKLQGFHQHNDIPIIGWT